MMQKLNKIIFASELMARWNIDESEFQQFFHNKLLTPYYYPPGKRPVIELSEYTCQISSPNSLPLIYDEGLQMGLVTDWGKVVFDENEINKVEVSYPELLNKKRGRPNNANDMLPLDTNNRLYLKAVEDNLNDGRHKIAELEAEIARLKEPEPATSKTAKAIETNQGRAADQWEGYLRAAVQLARYCTGADRQFTTKELEAICKKEGYGQLTERALKAFKESMPDSIVKRTPGAPKQG